MLMSAKKARQLSKYGASISGDPGVEIIAQKIKDQAYFGKRKVQLLYNSHGFPRLYRSSASLPGRCGLYHTNPVQQRFCNNSGGFVVSRMEKLLDLFSTLLAAGFFVLLSGIGVFAVSQAFVAVERERYPDLHLPGRCRW